VKLPASVLFLVLALAGCASLRDLTQRPPPPSDVEQRAYQSRTLDTANEHEVLRTVIATLQDLDYQVDHVNADLGLVGGVRGGARRQQRITVTVRARGDRQVIVRATLHGKRGGASRDSHQYQRFFAALEKSGFLKANQVD
jgi:hypothetical protein